MKGPSLTVATACSSSLVAVHMACQGLLAGETDMAVAGGVNLMLNPEFAIYLSGMTMISPEGHCKSFDASGDGYARGEGCGMVVLKRLDDAIRDNDPIRAIIRGTGVNSDGFTQGFTMPSSESQASLIREVYQKAGLDMSDTQFVECHVSSPHPRTNYPRVLCAMVPLQLAHHLCYRELVPKPAIRLKREQSTRRLAERRAAHNHW